MTVTRRALRRVRRWRPACSGSGSGSGRTRWTSPDRPTSRPARTPRSASVARWTDTWRCRRDLARRRPGRSALAAALLACVVVTGCGDTPGLDTEAVEAFLLESQASTYGDLELGAAECDGDDELKDGMTLDCTLAVSDAEVPYLREAARRARGEGPCRRVARRGRAAGRGDPALRALDAAQGLRVGPGDLRRTTSSSPTSARSSSACWRRGRRPSRSRCSSRTPRAHLDRVRTEETVRS